MSNQLEKLKKSIKKEYTKTFELSLMRTSGFIPVDKRQTDFFVILNKTSMDNKAKIEEIIKNKYEGMCAKFIPVETNEFDEIYSYVVKEITTKQEGEYQPTETVEPTPEEMLVTIGWISERQLQECQTISTRDNIPLDEVFRAKGYLS